MTLLWLALIAAVEAVIFLFRYRTANERSALVSAFMSFLISTMRIVFVLVGASAVLSGESWVTAIIVYAGVATITTGILHEWLERRKERTDGQTTRN